MVPTGPRMRGDEAQGVEYWRREAATWEQRAAELKAEIHRMNTPRLFRFRGIRGDKMWDRDFYRCSEEMWPLALEKRPYLSSWHTTVDGGVVFALSPADAVAMVAVGSEVGRELEGR